jgi:hypothetical protein
MVSPYMNYSKVFGLILTCSKLAREILAGLTLIFSCIGSGERSSCDVPRRRFLGHRFSTTGRQFAIVPGRFLLCERLD